MTQVLLATADNLVGRLTGLLAKVSSTTNVAVAGLPTIDGYQTLEDDTVLLTGQSTASQNGPWVVDAGAWTRPPGFTSGSAVIGGTVVVTGGTARAGTVWTLTTTGTVTVDTTSQTWVNAPVAGLAAALAAKADAAATTAALAGKEPTIAPGTYAEPSVAADAVIYVSKAPGASDSNTGLSPGKAKATIAAAMAALPVSGTPGGGGEIRLLFGEYVLSATATYTGDRLIIKGLGYGLTRIVAPAGALALDIGQAGVIGREFRMEGVTLYRATPGGAGLIRVRKMDQSRITDCAFAGGTTNIEMTNCIASVVERCGINSFTVDGLAIDNSDQVAITANTWETNFGGVNHINIQAGNKALSIAGNVFSTAVRAVYADGGPSDDCSLIGNVVENCPNGFLLAPASNPSSSRWTITGNNLRGTSAGSSVGIRVYGTNHTIVGNSVTQFTSSIDETGVATGAHLVVGNTVDVAVAITSAGSILALNGAGDIVLPATAKLAALGQTFFGTAINPAAGAIRLFPLSSPGRSLLQVGNGSAWQTVIEFLDTQRMAFFGASAASQPAANPDTSGASLADLETEVNQLKAALRTLGLIAT